MTDEVIGNLWVTPGTDDKLQHAQSTRTGSVKSGAKGIGRFVLNYLGIETEMLSPVHLSADFKLFCCIIIFIHLYNLFMHNGLCLPFAVLLIKNSTFIAKVEFLYLFFAYFCRRDDAHRHNAHEKGLIEYCIFKQKNINILKKMAQDIRKT